MSNELKFTVISDTHYYSKKNWVDGYPENRKPKNDQLFFSASEEIVKHTFADLCKSNTPEIILISGDLTYNSEKTSHEEMKGLLCRLKQSGKKVFVITATHDYYTPNMPTYGIDKHGDCVEVESIKREELLDYYGDFGYNGAISVHRASMSYAAQLADGFRLLALNDDYGNPNCGYSDDCFNWICEQVEQANKDGQFVVAMTHHPVIPPSPIFTAVAKGDMLDKYELRCRQLAQMGLPFILTGHTHMHNISSASINGKEFYDISTAALTGFPPAYREICINRAERKIDVRSKLVDGVPGVNTNGKALTDYTKNLFLGSVEDALYNAENDYERFADFAVGMSISKETSHRYKFAFKNAAKFLNHLTFGKVWRLMRFSSGVSKAEISRIYDKPVVPFAVDVAANLYKGDGAVEKTSTQYKLTRALLKKIDRMLKPFSKKLKSAGLESISSAVLPLLHKDGIGDANAVIYY